MRADLRLAPVALLLALLLAAGVSARAQTQSGYGSTTGQQAAQDFYNSQKQATQATATAADTSIVPQASGSTSDLEAYGANGAALSSAGQTASASSDDASLLVASTANGSSAGLTGGESWIAASQQIAANPQGVLASSGSAAQACSSTTTQQTSLNSNVVYTCETQTQVTDTTPSCVQNLVVDTTSIYDYQCQNTYDQTSRTWVISTACQALNTNQGCTPTGMACAAPAQPYFQAKLCTAGTQWSSASQSCTETRDVVVGTKYDYPCADSYDPVARTWIPSPACAALTESSACTQQSQSCSEPTPPINKTCQQSTAETAQTCDPQYQVAVGWNYVYNGHRIWNGTTWAPDGPESALQGAGGACQIQATNCTSPTGLPPTYSCTTGYSTQTATRECFPGTSDHASEYTLNGGQAPYTYLYYGIFYIGAPLPKPSTGIAPTSTIQAIVSAATNGNCTVPSTTGYYVNGTNADSYTVLAWNFMCKQPISDAPFAGMTSQEMNPAFCASTQLSSYDACNSEIWWNQASPGAANPFPGPNSWSGWLNTSNNPDYLNSALLCINQPPGCVKTGTNGETITLSCASQQAEPGCDPPTGLTLQSEACAATDGQGNCTATTYTYTDPTGGCSSWQDQWLCSADVPGADPAASATPYIASQGWSNACQALASNPACSVESDTVTTGQQTRTIDGMQVTEPAWSRHVVYACPTAAPVDSCTGNVTGCTETAAFCNATGPDGACTLFAFTYSCPNNNGSGGCEQESYSYVCTADIPPADPALSTTPYIVSDSLSPECSGLQANPACVLSGEVTDGSSTRTINGLEVSEPFWSKTDTYVCWSSQPIDGCTGNVTGCTQAGQTCAGDDQHGNCSVWTYAYTCPADDGSGSCSIRTLSFTCASDVPPADPATSVVTTETGSHWDTTCPEANDVDCHAQGTLCNDANSTKTVAGIQVTASCWQQTTAFSCEDKGTTTDDCDPPAGCTKTNDQCMDDPPAPDGACALMDHVYSCAQTSSQPVTASTCQSQLCIGQQCFSISGSSDSSNLGKAYSALATAQIAGQTYADPTQNLLIMSGTAYRCRRTILGFSNCCSDQGWGQDIGLASCDDQEKQLGQLKQAKSCHYIGDYCSNTAFWGSCLEKSQRYCCFQGSLSRIINEAGRPQVDKTWGSAKSPDCSGFTVAQFQALDLSNVDFSDFYAGALSALNPPGQSSTASSIQQTLNQLYGTGSPTTMTPATAQ